LSPADDIIIRLERPLDLDSPGQLVASVLSKPVGPTAKRRTAEAAGLLGEHLIEVGAVLGLRVDVVQGDGSQPVGRGIGPALEARDILAVLQGRAEAPGDLRERALTLAGRIIGGCRCRLEWSRHGRSVCCSTTAGQAYAGTGCGGRGSEGRDFRADLSTSSSWAWYRLCEESVDSERE